MGTWPSPLLGWEGTLLPTALPSLASLCCSVPSTLSQDPSDPLSAQPDWPLLPAPNLPTGYCGLSLGHLERGQGGLLRPALQGWERLNPYKAMVWAFFPVLGKGHCPRVTSGDGPCVQPPSVENHSVLPCAHSLEFPTSTVAVTGPDGGAHAGLGAGLTSRLRPPRPDVAAEASQTSQGAGELLSFLKPPTSNPSTLDISQPQVCQLWEVSDPDLLGPFLPRGRGHLIAFCPPCPAGKHPPPPPKDPLRRGGGRVRKWKSQAFY